MNHATPPHENTNPEPMTDKTRIMILGKFASEFADYLLAGPDYDRGQAIQQTVDYVMSKNREKLK